MKKGRIINIQKYCVHDGPGIRTTVFFKGCPLNCWWCHNPESQKFEKEMMYNHEKCTMCGECEKRCEGKGIKLTENIFYDPTKCVFCENCIDFCINNAREMIGKEYTISELMKEIKKDQMFYQESGGGVTLSGGEVMTQITFVEELVRRCKENGMHVAIDTCGYVPFYSFERILDNTDIFLYDIKLIDSKRHEKYTGKPNELILDNMKKLSEKGANIHLRIPLIEGINTDGENIEGIIKFASDLKISKVNLLPYHEIGSDKYKRLNMDYKKGGMVRPTDQRLEEIKAMFKESKFEVKIGG
ncbi:trans-4-hydroxy-L-proline dehydratase activase [Marinisporobacter balticus]|uniref:Pyruvate formate lyase activating enzyme n=1 Tax=Marinisporobacter balticus TaxID=2018667 RepID=A0A4R2KMZ2_9FIRM|nr:trans-4-hydroxy-L-proline dehydratase activase [Marinisporobacter balticus]TCO74824.1 pyruvate formate lyase activating enzyme [Marinisporobacter balticus]